MIKDELGAPWYEIYADLTPEPIAAASLVSLIDQQTDDSSDNDALVQCAHAAQQHLMTVQFNSCGRAHSVEAGRR